MARRANARRDWSPYTHLLTRQLQVCESGDYQAGNPEAIELAASTAWASELMLSELSGGRRLPRTQQAALYERAQRLFDAQREIDFHLIQAEAGVLQ